MEKLKNTIGIFLIMAGLIILTIVGTIRTGKEPLESYLITFGYLCFWLIVSLLLVGFLYFLLFKRK